MKAVVDLTAEEAQKLSDIHKHLKEALVGTTRDDWFENHTHTSGYAHYKFSGRVSDKLISLLGRMPTESEIIILEDGGFSHFGASCTITDRIFVGRVNTD